MTDDYQSAQINTGVDGIGHLLTDRLLAIPDYQRSYSWGEDEVTELWTDIQKAMRTNVSEYFLGSVVTTTSTSSVRQLVIDGQQRLATISLLYAAMRDIFSERSDERASDVERDFIGRKNMTTRQIEPKLTLNADDNEYYLSVINHGSVAPSRSSHRRLKFAFDYLYGNMRGLIKDRGADDWQLPLVALHDFVLTSAKVIDVHVPDENRSFVIFETLNDRGLNLNTADLLKNHLFGTAGPARIEEAKRRWSEMLGALGAANEDTVHDDFLRHYWSSTTGVGRVKALFSEMRDAAKDDVSAVALATSLAEAAPLWAGMFDVDSEFWRSLKPRTRERLQVLSNLKVEQCRPLLLAAMRRLAPAELEQVVAMLLSWSVRWFVSGGGSAGVTERLYAEAAKKVTDGDITTASQLADLFKARVPSDVDFERAFSVMTVRRGWLARYYLHELEREARRELGASELVPSVDWEVANLEHVLPKSYDPELWPDFSKEEHEAWVLGLGNQVILTVEENTRLGNASFEEKAPVLAQSDLVLTTEVGDAQGGKWNVDAVKQRQERLAALAVRAWPLA
jgi:hypothetical protein